MLLLGHPHYWRRDFKGLVFWFGWICCGIWIFPMELGQINVLHLPRPASSAVGSGFQKVPFSFLTSCPWVFVCLVGFFCYSFLFEYLPLFSEIPSVLLLLCHPLRCQPWKCGVGSSEVPGMPGMPVLLNPVWRHSLTPAEPAQAAGKPGNLPDLSQPQNCILKPTLDRGECSPAFNYQTQWATELPLHSHLTLMVFLMFYLISAITKPFPPVFLCRINLTVEFFLLDCSFYAW